MWLLPYPRQLPQDYYSKNLPPTPTPQPPVPGLDFPLPPTSPSTVAVNNGGIYYGDLPPANPQYGWLWTRGKGYLYLYMEPGIWLQVGTNW